MSFVRSSPRSLLVFSFQFFSFIILEIKMDASWARQPFSRSSAITLIRSILELVLWHRWAISWMGFGSGEIYFWTLVVADALDVPPDAAYHRGCYII